ncbi:class I SAM-dependent methyltransferase [Microvirga vignae]|uniref:class I SAM-dependent methyltransferase n=1 Tax=Microvirga vignae TaxID=1225564 RepID=UPI0006992F35|nr:class I SAM-dependent methyltransferase [Microvirga vignae]
MQSYEKSPYFDGRLRPGIKRLWQQFYPNNYTDAFERHVASLVKPDMKVLEIGAGSGSGLQNVFALKAHCAFYAGVDLDPRVLDNPYLDYAQVADASRLPFKDAAFDLVFHKMVAEHLEDPQAALIETARVLKTGGQLIFETPSRFYYPMLIARVTPTWFHRFYVRYFASGRTENEVFPTYYRLNDRRTIEMLCREVGLEPTITFHSTPPGYLRFSVVTFLLGVFYERSLERRFPALRARIWVSAQKTA